METSPISNINLGFRERHLVELPQKKVKKQDSEEGESISKSDNYVHNKYTDYRNTSTLNEKIERKKSTEVFTLSIRNPSELTKSYLHKAQNRFNEPAIHEGSNAELSTNSKPIENRRRSSLKGANGDSGSSQAKKNVVFNNDPTTTLRDSNFENDLFRQKANSKLFEEGSLHKLSKTNERKELKPINGKTEEIIVINEKQNTQNNILIKNKTQDAQHETKNLSNIDNKSLLKDRNSLSNKLIGSKNKEIAPKQSVTGIEIFQPTKASPISIDASEDNHKNSVDSIKLDDIKAKKKKEKKKKEESIEESDESDSDEDDGLFVFEPKPMQFECFNCKKKIQTFVYYKTGKCTWTVCGFLFFFGLWPFLIILFMGSCTKDAIHNCPECQSYLGIYRRPDDIERLNKKREKEERLKHKRKKENNKKLKSRNKVAIIDANK